MPFCSSVFVNASICEADETKTMSGFSATIVSMFGFSVSPILAIGLGLLGKITVRGIADQTIARTDRENVLGYARRGADDPRYLDRDRHPPSEIVRDDPRRHGGDCTSPCSRSSHTLDAANANANNRTTITFSLFPFFTFSLFHYSLFPVHCSLTKNALFFSRRIIDKKNKAFLKNKKARLPVMS